MLPRGGWAGRSSRWKERSKPLGPEHLDPARKDGRRVDKRRAVGSSRRCVIPRESGRAIVKGSLRTAVRLTCHNSAAPYPHLAALIPPQSPTEDYGIDPSQTTTHSKYPAQKLSVQPSTQRENPPQAKPDEVPKQS